MGKFIMLVGLPGSGKSTFAKNLGYNIFSSDELRKELWGDESKQGNNTELFTELHRRIKKALKNANFFKKPVIYNSPLIKYCMFILGLIFDLSMFFKLSLKLTV